MRRYHRLSLELPPDEEELLAAELWALGTIGLECLEGDNCSRIEAYFEAPLPTPLREEPSGWPDRGIRVLASVVLPETDWLAEHRATVQPLEIGRGWLVDAREPVGQPASSPGRTTLRIPARRAFGTGSHESTRLVLEWLEDLAVDGLRVLDLGSGSGVLSIAASHLGATRVVGLDVDPVAVLVSHENLSLNGVELELVAGELGCLIGKVFDLALVNILPSEWVEQVNALQAVLKTGSIAVFSGVPHEDSGDFVDAIGASGFEVEEERRAGDWVAVRVSIRG